MNLNMELDDKNVLVMKLLHYFITEKGYNPIILQGVENEIWLENMHSNYEIIRIVSNHIHNDDQYDFDVFKTKRIVKKIKRKTFSLEMNVFSFFLDMGDNITKDLNCEKRLNGVKVNEEEELEKNELVNKAFPELKDKMKYSEEGFDLFMKITGDINKHNKEDSKKVENVFKKKFPYVTYLLIAINVICFVVPYCMGTSVYNDIISMFCVHGPSIRDGGQFYRLITGAFLHGSIIHLLVNMYSLYIIGTQLESYLGKIKFTLVYFISLIFGSLLSIAFSGGTASIGASGAIFGLMGSLAYFGYHYRVFLGNIVKTQIIPIIILNLVIGFMLSGIDNFAHIGGLIGGALSTMALGIDNKSTTSEKVNGWIIMFIFLSFTIFIGFIYVK